MPAGPLALVGSGEYTVAMLEVERALLAGRPPRYVQVPTAAAPEGEAVLARWVGLGKEQAERLGVEQVLVDVRDRAAADSAGTAALLDGAGLVYLSGGNPAFLAATLRGTALHAAITSAWREGAALAGCSAGAMALTAWAPSLRAGVVEPGLDVVPHVRVLPHFDRMAAWLGEAEIRRSAQAPDGVTVVGVDEDTALVGGPVEWEVQGRQAVWLLGADGSREAVPAGGTVVTPV